MAAITIRATMVGVMCQRSQMVNSRSRPHPNPREAVVRVQFFVTPAVCTLHLFKKGKGRALDVAPQVRNPRGAQVHGAHQAASHVPALYM